jgi:Flp pilus assembly pilin Flp
MRSSKRRPKPATERPSGERGSATVEQAGLAALIALLLLAAISALAAGGEIDPRHDLAAAIGRRLVCAPRLPGACRHHPLVPAYGWPLARLARALAPAPVARAGPEGLPLVPVDFRRCRRPSCAVPRPGPDGTHLTTAGRRTTAFTQLDDRRGARGWVELTYWLYRPSLGWERVMRRASEADVEAAAHVSVLLKDDPALVPLETLPGRDQYEFPPGDEPPWRWRIHGLYPGWSS